MPDHERKNTVGLAVKQAEYLETRIRILEKTLESKLDDYFAIVPKEIFEEAK